jgi:nitroimidazol reductase NimA-like FMN-containing flavoprotein (pyridoxamine 5'-phosphate oxidase superfamily)
MQPAKQKTKTMIKQQIIEFLNATCGLPSNNFDKDPCGTHHRTCLVLATCYKNIPRATPLEFFNEGITLYVFAEPSTKVANIKHNPAVSAAIYHQPLDHSVLQKSLQIFGKAELISMQKNPRLFKAKAKKWNLYVTTEKLAKINTDSLSKKQVTALIEKTMSAFFFIKIVPHRIIVREYHPDFSMPKYEWKR